MTTSVSDYERYRGKCLEFSRAAVAADPTLTLVRGHYVCPVWGRQAHWWTTRQDGTVFDPSKDQFPSRGAGVYEPYGGYAECRHCDRWIRLENETSSGPFPRLTGQHPICSEKCLLAFHGFTEDDADA